MATTSKGRRRAIDFPLDLAGVAEGDLATRTHAALRAAILDGRLVAGAPLPSTRALAERLGVRRNVVIAAYEHLQGDGLIEARIGSGTVVAATLVGGAAAATNKPSIPKAPPRNKPFILGRALPDPILNRQLGAALRRHAIKADADALDYGDTRGPVGLRVQVAAWLATHRGVFRDPDSIMILSGARVGFRLCAEALLTPGDTVWVEDPGYPAARQTLAAAGVIPVPVPVDGEGLMVDVGARHHPTAKAVYITPSHQFPTGVTMSMARRVALVDWARANGAWIIEDDYDAEYRFAGPPLTALAGIGGGDRVIHIGTFSKTLFPGIRLAHLSAPGDEMARLMATRLELDRIPSILPALAVADLLESGAYADHLRRWRSRHRAARDAVVATLTQASRGLLTVNTPSQGLHLVAWPPDGAPPGAAAAIRRAAGVQAPTIAENSVVPPARDGLVVGYSGFAIEALVDAAAHLGRAARVVLGG